MYEKLFHAHKDTHNPNNPYPDFVRKPQSIRKCRLNF